MGVTFASQGFDAGRFLQGVRIAIPDTGLCVRRLGPGDFSILLEFRADVIASLNDADYIHEEPDEHAFVRQLLEPANLITSVWDRGALVGWSGLICPSSRADLDDFHIGRQVALRAEVNQSAYIAGTMVHLDYRGLGLQNYMTYVRNEAVLKMGRTHHFATAAYGNHFSWGNAVRNGFRIVDALAFNDPNYGRLERMFMHRAPSPAAVHADRVWLAARDVSGQRRMCLAGLIGTEWRLQGGVAEIGFQAPVDQPVNDVGTAGRLLLAMNRAGFVGGWFH